MSRVYPAADACATTEVRRYRRECHCPTYPTNCGACASFEVGANGLCVYCDHKQTCHRKGGAVTVSQTTILTGKLTEALALHVQRRPTGPDGTPTVLSLSEYLAVHLAPAIAAAIKESHRATTLPNVLSYDAIELAAFNELFRVFTLPAPPHLDWTMAYAHLQEVRRQYVEIGGPGVLALTITLNPLVVRYERGERTQKLYDEILATT